MDEYEHDLVDVEKHNDIAKAQAALVAESVDKTLFPMRPGTWDIVAENPDNKQLQGWAQQARGRRCHKIMIRARNYNLNLTGLDDDDKELAQALHKAMWTYIGTLSPHTQPKINIIPSEPLQ